MTGTSSPSTMTSWMPNDGRSWVSRADASTVLNALSLRTERARVTTGGANRSASTVTLAAARVGAKRAH